MNGTGSDTPGAGQEEVIAFLSDPGNWSSKPDRVEHIETHGAHVFLAGERVLKIKRAIRFSYMDFSTPEKRRLVCEREIEVNRRFAPQIYLGIVPIVKDDTNRLRIGGAGEIVEWAVSMRRFDQNSILSRLVARGELPPALVKSLAAVVLGSHRAAKSMQNVDPASDLHRTIIDVAGALSRTVDKDIRDLAAVFKQRACQAWEGCAELLARRRDLGFVRRCHGDLHLNNIVLIDGTPTLFDALEFDETLATIDTLYDLSFLLMDLLVAGRCKEANLLLGQYLWLSGSPVDLEGLRALPVFMSVRAAIRAMVGLQRAEIADDNRTERSALSPRTYLTLATRLLMHEQPRLVAVGGYSGTGKSTLAAVLAPLFGSAPGALHIRSDLERKALHGVGETDSLPQSAYTPDVHAAVYQRMGDRARIALDAGHSVILDAVFANEVERSAAESIAVELNLQFDGLWLTASPDALELRIRERRNDASDATPEVAQAQLARGAGQLTWACIDANGGPDEVFGRASASLNLQTDGKSK